MCTREEREIIEKCLIDYRNGKDDARKHSVDGLSEKAYWHLCREIAIGESNLIRQGVIKCCANEKNCPHIDKNSPYWDLCLAHENGELSEEEFSQEITNIIHAKIAEYDNRKFD